MDLNLNASHSMGTTIIRVTYDGGVVLGADSRTSTGMYVANRASDKITELTDNVYVCCSGSAADSQIVSDYVRYYVHQHIIQLGQPATVKVAANLTRLLSYQNKNMLGTGLIVGGWDQYGGGQIYSIPLGGSIIEQPFAIGGSGSPYLYGFFDQAWKKDLTEEEAEKHIEEAGAVKELQLVKFAHSISTQCPISIVWKIPIAIFIGLSMPTLEIAPNLAFPVSRLIKSCAINIFPIKINFLQTKLREDSLTRDLNWRGGILITDWFLICPCLTIMIFLFSKKKKEKNSTVGWISVYYIGWFYAGLVKRAISLAIARDSASGDVVRTVIINKEGVMRHFFPGDELPLWHEELAPTSSLLDLLTEPMST
ncbi:proteasome subunit beta type-6 [Amborella trichopoda]|uniref:proteasome subunit beta type-6 n=1 Tax=Amborella trichopoda TaxID=13333 RepID=UPI0009BF6B0A|nr:proteasome subunit beta type-6 [Amborella trichopoda]|eukprot:XP_020520528.1 proteasome subunit beta type-6 [Amborella trichopoda]